MNLNKKEQELDQLKKQLAQVVDYEDWWNVPNESFYGKSPIEQFNEDSKPLWDMIFRLQSGMPG